jgi:hypothetical protein
MKALKKNYSLSSILLLSLSLLFNCGGSDGGSNSADSDSVPDPVSEIILDNDSFSFGEVYELDHSESQILNIIGNNINSDLNLTTSANFEISLDDSSFFKFDNVVFF